jgi:hypothetical protein
MLQGEIPISANHPSGCRLHTRCWKAPSPLRRAINTLLTDRRKHHGADNKMVASVSLYIDGKGSGEGFQRVAQPPMSSTRYASRAAS